MRRKLNLTKGRSQKSPVEEPSLVPVAKPADGESDISADVPVWIPIDALNLRPPSQSTQVEGNGSMPASTTREKRGPAGGYRVFAHRELLDGATTRPLQKRLHLVVTQILANGRPNEVKPVAGNDNRVWMRSPMGGQGGFHYYLWWTRGNQLSFGGDPTAVYLRCIRHHDDHTPLSIGEHADYADDPYHVLEAVEEPTTDEQREFVESPARVRLVNGWPGSGKTTSLWLAVERRCLGPTLYLTWSEDLANAARNRFLAFSSADSDIQAMSFEGLWTTITEEAPTRISYQEALQRFRGATEQLNKEIAPWRGNLELLFGELRARYIGTYGSYEATRDSIHVGTRERKDYLATRSSEIGRAEAKAVETVFGLLERSDDLRHIFPELLLSLKCRHVLEMYGMPDGLRRFEHVVVDEVQDLTRVEILTLLFAARAIALANGKWPEMLFAGDERQTVRPTLFRWADLTRPLGAAVSKPEKFDLHRVLRCPENVSQVLENLCDLWGALPREERPGKAVGVTTERHLQGVIMHARARTWLQVQKLVTALEDSPGTRFVAITADDHARMPEEVQGRVMLPAQVKGLDFQTVFVLLPGKALLELEDSKSELSKVHEMGNRRKIDSLCVAISRTSEALVLIDVDEGLADEMAVKCYAMTRQFAPTAQPADVSDLIDQFKDTSQSPEELALRRCEEAKRVVHDNPNRAWLCVTQAFRMLGDSDLPNGVSNRTTRNSVCQTLTTIATQIVEANALEGQPERRAAQIKEITEVVGAALEELRAPTTFDAFSRLISWRREPNEVSKALALVEQLARLPKEEGWFRPLISLSFSSLRRAIPMAARSEALASRFVGPVDRWLEAVGDERAVTIAPVLRETAFRTLLASTDPAMRVHARRIFEMLPPGNTEAEAMLLESEGRFDEASSLFCALGRDSDAYRCLRKDGNWKKALDVAPRNERLFLEWLIDVQEISERSLPGLRQWLSSAERAKLDDLADRIAHGQQNEEVANARNEASTTPTGDES